MQMSQQTIPVAAMYDHLFDTNRRENRIEFVSDFPDGNDAEVVSALQVYRIVYKLFFSNLFLHSVYSKNIRSVKRLIT